MKKVEAAVAVLHHRGRFYFQRRPKDSNVGASGLVGLFGGRVEDGETSAAAVARELQEEADIAVAAERFKEVGRVTAESDKHGETIRVSAAVFVTEITLEETQQLFNGSLPEGALEGPYDYAAIPRDEFTPVTRAVFEELITRSIKTDA